MSGLPQRKQALSCSAGCRLATSAPRVSLYQNKYENILFCLYLYNKTDYSCMGMLNNTDKLFKRKENCS